MTKDGVVVEPYRDQGNSVEARVEDLLGRLSLASSCTRFAVVASRSDVAFDTADPVFRFGDGLQS